MMVLRSWFNLFRSTGSSWVRLLLLVLIVAIVGLVWYVANVAVLAIALFLGRFVGWLASAFPLIILLVIMTYGMGKPGRTLRSGTLGLINNVIVGLFAVMGVGIELDRSGRDRYANDDD